MTYISQDVDILDKGELLGWVKDSIKTGTHLLNHGYQAHVYLYEGNGQKFIIKAPTGWGLGRLIRRAMLRREYRIYSKLSGVNGVPRCYGLLEGSYLILEFIDGVQFQKAEIKDRSLFFKSFLQVIQDLHNAGVAHADLKKKDNLLVMDGQTVYVIDFGAAIMKKRGFLPFSRYLYNLGRKFDFNAWVKLKYKGKFTNMEEDDIQYYNRTKVEKVFHWIKQNYLKLKKSLTCQTLWL